MVLSDLEPVDFHHLDSCQQKPNYFFPHHQDPTFQPEKEKRAARQQREQHFVMMLSLFIFVKAGMCHLCF